MSSITYRRRSVLRDVHWESTQNYYSGNMRQNNGIRCEVSTSRMTLSAVTHCNKCSYETNNNNNKKHIINKMIIIWLFDKDRIWCCSSSAARVSELPIGNSFPVWQKVLLHKKFAWVGFQWAAVTTAFIVLYWTRTKTKLQSHPVWCFRRGFGQSGSNCSWVGASWTNTQASTTQTLPNNCIPSHFK